MDRKVIVFGATGKTGIHICNELELQSIPYSVFVREQSSNKISNSSIEVKRGDVLNSQEVENSFQNENYTDVIIALGSKDLKSVKIRSIGTKNIVNAMMKNQSGATIHMISALGVGNSWSQLKWHAKLISNLLIKSTMNDHAAQEKVVTGSSYSYHIIRPVGLKDGASLGEVHVQNDGFLPSNYIQRTDVAKFLVSSLLEGKTGTDGICQKKD